jgi:hypothetical protein
MRRAPTCRHAGLDPASSDVEASGFRIVRCTSGMTYSAGRHAGLDPASSDVERRWIADVCAAHLRHDVFQSSAALQRSAARAFSSARDDTRCASATSWLAMPRHDEHALILARAARVLAAHHLGHRRIDPARRLVAEELGQLFAKLLAAVDDEEVRFLDEIASRLRAVERRDNGARRAPRLLEHRARAVRGGEEEIGAAHRGFQAVSRTAPRARSLASFRRISGSRRSSRTGPAPARRARTGASPLRRRTATHCS